MKKFRPIHFVALFLVSLVVAWRPLLRALKLALENDGYTHILLILPLTVTFICADWKQLQPILRPSVRFGFSILCLAGVIPVLTLSHTPWMTADLRLTINMLSLVTCWIGAFVLCFGTGVARAMVFPLGFLYWMVPIPSIALNRIVECLQQGSALATRLLFAIAGVPVVQDGLSLTIPGLTVEVAQECSSIRSSLMLLVTAMVLAQILLRSPWGKSLVIALAVPLSVAKNGLRIFTIAMLTTRVDPSYLTGKLHHDGGVVFFAIALAAVFFLCWILRRVEGKRMQQAVLPQLGPARIREELPSTRKLNTAS